MTIAVCFSCNEAYMPLCKGLVLSLRGEGGLSPGAVRSLHFIDIGCSEASLHWLGEQGVSLHEFSREAYYGQTVGGDALPDRTDALPRYADAQLCRPFLPVLVPGKTVYVWIDCDIWLQSRDCLSTYVQAAVSNPDKIALCPEYHYGYLGYRNPRFAYLLQRRWYEALYDDADMIEELSFQPIFNSGFFALRGKNPLWRLWAEEIAAIYPRGLAKYPAALHYAEQIALNRLIYERKAAVPLDPIHNYACAGSAVFLNPHGKVAVGRPPFAPVKAVHLLDFSKYGDMYLQKKLLFDQGEYLTSDERAALLACIAGP